MTDDESASSPGNIVDEATSKGYAISPRFALSRRALDAIGHRWMKSVIARVPTEFTP